MDNGADSYRRFLQGDDDGLAEIVRDYKDGLMMYLNGYVSDISVAEELTEETFVKLVLKRPRFLKHSTFKTWLYAIARNVAMDYLKHRKNAAVSIEECPQLVSEEDDLEREYIRQEEKVTVHRAMKRLKREYRQVLWLIYFEDFSNKQAARILGKSTHNVETLVYRARQALKSKLNEEGYVYEKL